MPTRHRVMLPGRDGFTRLVPKHRHVQLAEPVEERHYAGEAQPNADPAR